MADSVTTIRGYTFKMGWLPPKAANRVATRLLKMAVETLGRAPSIADVKHEQIIQGIVANTNLDADLDAVIDALMRVTSVSPPAAPEAASMGQTVPFLPLSDMYDATFGEGRIGLQLAWLVWGLQYQFGPFFSDLQTGGLASLLGKSLTP